MNLFISILESSKFEVLFETRWREMGTNAQYRTRWQNHPYLPPQHPQHHLTTWRTLCVDSVCDRDLRMPDPRTAAWTAATRPAAPNNSNKPLRNRDDRWYSAVIQRGLQFRQLPDFYKLLLLPLRNIYIPLPEPLSCSSHTNTWRTKTPPTKPLAERRREPNNANNNGKIRPRRDMNSS